ARRALHRQYRAVQAAQEIRLHRRSTQERLWQGFENRVAEAIVEGSAWRIAEAASSHNGLRRRGRRNRPSQQAAPVCRQAREQERGGSPVDAHGGELLVTKHGRAGIVALNRPKALNALTLQMVDDFTRALEHFEADEEIASVIVRSDVESAFCAGGDMRAIYHSRKEGRHEEADAFFEREFALNRFIHDFAKPYISLIDGICFGGGMGITIHGRHRVVGEKAVLAMPETAIGYFPDVGASFFLN